MNKDIIGTARSFWNSIVIGLGVFGATIARELTRLGHEVLGIDSDEHRVDRLAEEITHAAIADVTDENALTELNCYQQRASGGACCQTDERSTPSP